jgi:hypothetical protein
MDRTVTTRERIIWIKADAEKQHTLADVARARGDAAGEEWHRRAAESYE